MQFTRELMKIDDQRSLVLWVDGNGNNSKDDVNKFVVCSYYDPAKPIGQQWCWGHYFDSLIEAMELCKRIEDWNVLHESKRNS